MVRHKYQNFISDPAYKRAIELERHPVAALNEISVKQRLGSPEYYVMDDETRRCPQIDQKYRMKVGEMTGTHSYQNEGRRKEWQPFKSEGR